MTTNSAASPEPNLNDLIELPRWQSLQDHFAGVLGIPLRTIAPDQELLTTPSWPSSIIAQQAIRLLNIGEELGPLLKLAQDREEISSLTTPLGVTYGIIPIHLTFDRSVAYFVVGPVVVGPREHELEFRQRINRLGLEPGPLWVVLLSLKLYTFSGVRSVLNLLEEVGTSLAQLAYQAAQLPHLLPTVGKLDRAVISYYTDRILHSLLEAATMATKADGGSVLAFDDDDTMKIKAAQGLSADVVVNTRVKRGQGLAGLAAAERTVLLVDDTTTDPRLKPLMNRKDIVSSLIAPLTPESEREPIGVLSLRTSNSARRFTQEHVELLRRLLDVADIAMGGLRLIFPRSPSS